jgi:hypothetical protein
MGITYSSWARVGFSFSEEDLFKPFTHLIKDAYTTEEPRFDPKTGQPIAPQVIQHGAKTEVRFKGEEVGDFWGDEEGSLGNLIAKDLGCEVDYYGSQCEGESFYAFYLPVETGEAVMDSYKVSMGGDLDYEDVVSKADELKELRSKLNALGLNPDKPKILCVWHCG